MSDGARDKYAQRFDGPDGEDSEQTGEPSEGDGQSGEVNDKSVENAWSEGNVKKDWNGWTVYLPDELDGPFDDEFNRLQYELDRDIKKDRHYKPLMVALALDRLERMDSTEVSEFLERMERMELPVFEE